MRRGYGAAAKVIAAGALVLCAVAVQPLAPARGSETTPRPQRHQTNLNQQAKALLDAALARQRADGRLEAYSEYGNFGAYISNYMAGIFWESAILYDRLVGDPRIVPAMRRWADWTWATQWSADGLAFRYQDTTAAEGRGPFTIGGRSIWSNVPESERGVYFGALNGLMLPAWGYLSARTGDPKYAAQGTLMLKGLMRDAPTQTLPKQFPQMYRSSPQYLGWTATSVAPAPALITRNPLLDVLVGPLTKAGEDRDRVVRDFDATGEQLGRKWGDCYPCLGQNANDANFYDVVLTVYILYARTGDPRWLARARDIASKVRDSYHNSVATVRVVDLQDWSVGGSVPNGRTRASLGLAVHALEAGDESTKRIVFYKGEHAARGVAAKSWWGSEHPVFPYGDGREAAGELTALLSAVALGYEGPFSLPPSRSADSRP